MNKLLLIILAGSALFSCAGLDQQGTGDDAISHDGTLECITAVSPGAHVKTLTEDGVKVLWEDGDQIGMYVAESSTDNELKRKAVFTTNLDMPSDQARFGRTSDLKTGTVNEKYLAVYPASAVAKWNISIGEENPFCYVNVPAQQTAIKGSWDKNAAVLAATSETKEFVFRHVVSYLRFDVTEQSGEFVSVRLSSVNKEKLSGQQAGVRYVESNKLEVIPDESSTDYVVLRSPDNVAFEVGGYYMTFMPGEFAEGLTLTFTNAEGLVAEKKISKLALSAGDVLDLDEITSLEFKEPGGTPVKLVKNTVYVENGVDQGVVYWVDPENPYRGKVVSAVSDEILWSEGLIWTEKIQSTTDGLANYEQFKSSPVYTDRKEEYYALKYCESLRESLGGNWYLPAPGELQTLFNVYYGLSISSYKNGKDYRSENGAMDAKREFDEALKSLGEMDRATLDGDANGDGVSDNVGFGNESGVSYWTSKINTGGPVQYVNFGVYNLRNNKNAYTTLKCYVRCIRDVE